MLQKTLDYTMTQTIMVGYAGLENKYGFVNIKDQLKELEQLAGRSFTNF
jgi:hypothetical protein